MSARDSHPPVDYQADPHAAFTHSTLRNDAPVGAVAAHTVARTIQDAMTERGLTLRSLAAATGIHHATISRTLRGLTYPDVATLAELQVFFVGVNLWPPPEDGSADHR